MAAHAVSLARMWHKWKGGVGALVRLGLASLVVGFVLWPTRLFDLVPASLGWISTIGNLFYFLVVLPLTLPAILRLCGLGPTAISLFNLEGGMNEASRDKQEQLDRAAGERTA